MSKYTGKDLTVVVCAYKECATLEKSVKCILNQTVRPNIVISTSTPNNHINNIAQKYGIEILINQVGGHVKDYNFALSSIKTPLGMLAHQDDLLHQQFVEKSLKAINTAKDPILSFTNYREMHEDVIDKKPSIMIRIKNILTWPIRIPGFRRTVLAKRLLNCFGDPITHPTVMCVMKKMPEVCFEERFRACMDWDLWERLSHQTGEFVYVKEPVLYHRMSKENATAVLFESTNCRYEEEFEILSRFWPKWMVKLIMIFYSKAANFY